MYTEGNILVLCDHGRKIYVEKLPDRSFLIEVCNFYGNFDEFALKALRTIICADGLVHMLYPPSKGGETNDLSNYYAYGEISDFH